MKVKKNMIVNIICILFFSVILLSTVSAVENKINSIDIQDCTTFTLNQDNSINNGENINKDIIQKKETKPENLNNNSYIKTDYEKEKKEIEISLNNLEDTTYKNNIQITGQINDEDGLHLNNTPVNIKINEESFETITDEIGFFNYTYKTKTVGKNNLSIVFDETSDYYSARINTTFNVNPRGTKIIIYPIEDADFTGYAVFTGKLLDEENKPITNTLVNFTINNQSFCKYVTSGGTHITRKFFNRTDNQGLFTYIYNSTKNDIILDKLGPINFTATFYGTSRYKPTTTNTTFNVVKTDTKIAFDHNFNKTYRYNVKLQASFITVYGKVIKYAQIKCSINGKNYYNETNSVGHVSFNFTIDQKINNLTLSYVGNSYYNASSNNFVFEATPIPCYASIVTQGYYHQYNDEFIMTGYIYYKTKKSWLLESITNYPVTLGINDKIYNMKTDENGEFSLKIKATKMGKNPIYVECKGSNFFEPLRYDTQFIITKKSTNITVNQINNAKYRDTITISGKFTDKNGIILRNSRIKININGNEYYNKTDNNGIYTLIYKTCTIGTNNITVSYPGNSHYRGTNYTTTFNVTRKETKIEIDSTNSSIESGSSILISGRFINKDGTALRNSRIAININGTKHYVKTDDNGFFNYTYIANKVGVFDITISYGGNSHYFGTRNSLTLTVIKD